MQRLNLDTGRPQLLTSTEEVLQTCTSFREKGEVAIDTESTGLRVTQDVALFIGLSDGDRRVAVKVDSEEFAALESLLGDPKVVKILHNAKYDAWMLANRGMKMVGPWHDTLVMASMSDSSRSSKKLKDLLVSLYGPDDERSIRYSDFSETFGKVTKKKSAKELLQGAPIEKVLQYITCDAWGTFQIYRTLRKQLQKIRNWRDQTLWELFTSIEVPFTEVLWGMERQGAKIDVGKLEQLGADWTKELQETELKFAQSVGRPININSVPQLRDYFLLERDLKTSRRTMGGESGEAKASLDKVTLGLWADSGIVEAAQVLRYRQLGKLVSTYVKPLLELRDTNDRVHTSYTQMVDTGRLASDSPNLQNIPVRTKDGKKIRECFIADEGFDLLVRDYDQLEMKLAAALSGDPNMIRIIREGKDIHSGNASVAFDVPYEDIMSAVAAKDALGKAKQAGLPGVPLTSYQLLCLEHRDRSKTIGFETLYGGGIRKLAVLLKCGVEKAIEVQTRFFAPFQVLLRFIKRTHEEARSQLCVQTITGRFRTLPAAALDRTAAQAEAFRQAFNTKVQGSGADAVKIAMILVWADPDLHNWGNLLELQVHDELISEVPKEMGERIDQRIAEHMENSLSTVGLKLPIRLTSSGKRAANWAAAK
jgi:DNA polymerase-1